MAQTTINSDDLRKLTDRLQALENQNKALTDRIVKAEQYIAQLKLETGSLRQKAGGFT